MTNSYCEANGGSGYHCFCGQKVRSLGGGLVEALCCYCGLGADEVEVDEFDDDGSDEDNTETDILLEYCVNPNCDQRRVPGSTMCMDHVPGSFWN